MVKYNSIFLVHKFVWQMYTNLTRIFFVVLVCVLFNAQVFAADETDAVDSSAVVPAESISDSVKYSFVLDSAGLIDIDSVNLDSVVLDSTDYDLDEQDSTELAKTVFSSKNEFLFSVRLLLNYNYIAFSSSEFDGGTLQSNRPIDFGLGLGIKDFSFDVRFSLPYTLAQSRKRSVGFDTGLDFFPKDLWMQAKYRRYSGLSVNNIDDEDSTETAQPVDFRQQDIYLSILWIKAGKENFSVRAPYFLDRIQAKSAGSFIFGGKFQYTTAQDRARAFEYYSKKRNIYSTWAQGGYSYTWVVDHNFFLNGWAMGGMAVGAVGNGAFGFFPDLNVKIAFGQWHHSWSWNAVVQATYAPSFYWRHVEQRYLSSFELLVVKRF